MKNFKFLAKSLILIVVILLLKYYLDNHWFQYKDIVLEDTNLEDLEAEIWIKKLNTTARLNRSMINIIDLNTRLRPKRLYESIKCRKSIKHIVRTTLCVHDIAKDTHVSRLIWENGVWEQHVLRPFVDYIYAHQDWLVIDIGAQIGQYTLFAAQMGLRVLAVEPYYDSILRLHKAARIERLEDKITLVQNAISNKRNETKLLQESSDNIGGQGLLNNQYKTYVNNAHNKYLVQTILFDDLISVLPRTNENQMYKQAIIKIDIEGYEPYAFKHAAKFFDAIDVQVIFMEWGTLIKESSLHDSISEMVEFLVSRNYSAYGSSGNYLEPIRWGIWSDWDIIWRRNK